MVNERQERISRGVCYNILVKYFLFVFLPALLFGSPHLIIPTPTITPTVAIVRFDSKKVLTQVNEYRRQKKLTPLVWNESMCPFTKKRLNDMYDDYTHKGFWEMVKGKHPYPYEDAGENLAEITSYNTSESELALLWYNHVEHRENILNPHYTDTCIEVSNYYAVEEFASF
jgi:uncharacterized protein YkwD